MSYILGTVQALLILGIALLEYKKKSPAMFLWATLFVLFGITHLFTILSVDTYNVFSIHTGSESYTDSVLISASVFVIIFCLVYIATRFIFWAKSRPLIPVIDLLDNSGRQSHLLLLVLFSFFVATRLFLLVSYLGGISNTSWGMAREYSASLPYFNVNRVLSSGFYTLSGLALYYLYIKKYPLAIYTCILTLASVLITRNRIEILPILIAFIAKHCFKIKKIKLITLVRLAVVGIIALYVVYGIRVFRHYGTLGQFMQNVDFVEFNAKIIEHLSNSGGELGLRQYFYYFIKHDNSFEEFGQGHSYLRMFLVFLPTRWSFGLKPEDFAVSMGTAIGMPSGGSMHPTLFGDCFANFGWAGVFLGVFWALYATIMDRIISKRKHLIDLMLLYSLVSFGYIIIGRGSVYNGFFYVTYGSVIILFARFFSKLRLPRF